MWLKPMQRRYLGKIIPFGIMWGVFGLVYVLVEYGLLGSSAEYPSTKNPYSFDSSLLFVPPIAIVVGSLLGAIEILYLNKLFINRSFWKKILFKTIVYILLILLMLISMTASANSYTINTSLFDPLILESIIVFVGNFSFWSIVIYAGLMTVISLYVTETADYLGGSVFNNFFTGKYHRPLEEDRIFMFLDMKSSTTIAEKLGHRKYFTLLNQYYADTTDAIINTSGEVYQYAGDEIIVSWNLESGLHDNNCIQCFFKIKQKIESGKDTYMEKFGLMPKFKAGIHYGKVTTGEIGVMKKEIFFTGDVLNTTARIQGMCNQMETDILVSQDLLSCLKLEKGYVIVPKGECELKGRKEKIHLYSIAALDTEEFNVG